MTTVTVSVEAPVAAARPRRRGWRHRMHAWWLRRLPVADHWTLTQRNVYILPTKGGVAFAITLLLMLLASINYQLSLGYVLTFLLAGSGLVSMHQTHGTLRGLTLRIRPPAPVFAGETASIDVVLGNDGAARHGVGVRLFERRSGHAWCEVPAHGSASARISIQPDRRGWHPVPTLVIETRFPFGLFRAWSVWRPAARVLAYPRPEQPPPPLPGAEPVPGESRHAQRAEGAELDGVRSWRRGDSLRQIAWKKAARTGELVSRESASFGSRELRLDWHATHVSGVEARLSRLAAWVLAAERMGLAFGLRLPGAEIAPALGDAHRRAVLETLALWS